MRRKWFHLKNRPQFVLISSGEKTSGSQMGQLLERRARYRDVCRLKAEIRLRNVENIHENNKNGEEFCAFYSVHVIFVVNKVPVCPQWGTTDDLY